MQSSHARSISYWALSPRRAFSRGPRVDLSRRIPARAGLCRDFFWRQVCRDIVADNTLIDWNALDILQIPVLTRIDVPRARPILCAWIARDKAIVFHKAILDLLVEPLPWTCSRRQQCELFLGFHVPLMPIFIPFLLWNTVLFFG